jgi:hypothetical protein
MVVQFHIFLNSRVFGVESSTVQFCFFTPLYPTDSKLGTSHVWYRFNGDGSSICWYQESTFFQSQRRQNFIDSVPGEQKQKISENIAVKYVIRFWFFFLKNPWCLLGEKLSFGKISMPLSYTLKIVPLFLSVTLALLTQPRAIMIHTAITWLLRKSFSQQILTERSIKMRM